MAAIVGIEVEVALPAGSMPVVDLLEVLRHRYPAVPFCGKGDGWFLRLGEAAETGGWIKVAGDSAHCGNDLLELSTAESYDLGAVTQLVAIQHLLTDLQDEFGLRFLWGIVPPRRAAFQISVDYGADPEQCYLDTAPLLTTIGSGAVSVGGFSRLGYVPAPRLAMSDIYHDDHPFLAPLAYPRRHLPDRLHVSLEYPRSPFAAALQTGIVVLAVEAHRRWPELFADTRHEGSLEVAHALDRLDHPGAALQQRRYAERLASRSVELIGPWAEPLLETWTAVIDAVQNDTWGAGTLPYSDLAMKRAELDSCFTRAGLDPGSPEAAQLVSGCYHLLSREHDLDVFLSDRSRSSTAWELSRRGLQQLTAVWWDGLRDALLCDLNFLRLGPESPCDLALSTAPAKPWWLEPVRLAPRAETRHKYLDLGVESADWTGIQTRRGWISTPDVRAR